MYDVSAQVHVKKIEQDRRILMDWAATARKFTTVEWRFVPWGDDGTYVEVTETGLSGDGDQLAHSPPTPPAASSSPYTRSRRCSSTTSP